MARRILPILAAFGAAALALVGVCGCSDLSELRDGAAAAAAHFRQAVQAQDWAAACEALAPASRDELEQNNKAPCPQALGGQELPDAGRARHTDVHGEAMAVFAQDTVFLAHFPSGWKVTAAGCQQQPGDRPYRCALKGR
ncbi:hypothetical protein [Yinghuangia soli]|uniref:Lipoprotein n=1 Tax=Yinghuangia soli TaxID=2908204 RepID=A0AA41PWG8_9ACTN|nr:hypothetical protein [Yinghuangia soli]MCF2527198.1 hypothetical protein [Yinghuangia soli]